MAKKDTKGKENLWNTRIGAFAAAVSKNVEDVNNVLKEVVGEPGDEALAVLDNVTAVPDADLKAAFAAMKIPSGVLNMHLSKLRGVPLLGADTANGLPGKNSIQALSILPSVPDEVSFIEMLKTGGVLKPDVAEVLSAVKAALANKIGLYDLPEKIMAKMEAIANALEEPWGPAFYKMQNILNQKKYGDVLSTMGLPGNFVSEARKKQFLTKVDAKLWTALIDFHNRLTAWYQNWKETFTDPSMIFAALANKDNAAAAGMFPGMMNAPDTLTVHTAGEEVINEINRVFAGPGIPVARALAYDATRIMGILDDDSLPAQLGASTKDQMIKELGIGVGADIVRTEQSVTRYCLAIMSLPKVAPDAEVPYLTALIQLGSSIGWEKLSSRPAGIGVRQQL